MIKILSLAILAMLLSGCVSSPVTGMFYTNAIHPGVGSGGIVDNNIKTEKVGTSTCKSILGLVAYGDCSVDAAKQNGEITKVNSIDHQSKKAMFYGSYSTIVRGE